MLNQSKIFYLAISFSLLLHILFILGVKIQPDYTKFLRDKIPPLEVVIVSNPAEKAPPQASLLAQTNHDADAGRRCFRVLRVACRSRKQRCSVASAVAAADARGATAVV